MNVENGNVMDENSMRELMDNMARMEGHDEGFDEKVADGRIVPVWKENLTSDQLNRLANEAQPVVMTKDHRSPLGRQRLEALRALEERKKVASRRAKNKAAKKARKKNR